MRVSLKLAVFYTIILLLLLVVFSPKAGYGRNVHDYVRKNDGIQFNDASSSSSSTLGPSANAPEAPQPRAYFAYPKCSIQHSLDNPVFLMKRHRSLTVAVHIYFGSAVSSPKTI